MNTKDFQIQVLLDKKAGTTHKDSTLPRVATKKNSRGLLGEFFVLSLLVISNSAKISQGKPIKFTVWNDGQRALIFDKLKNALANPTNVTKDLDGNAILSDNAAFLNGELRKEDTGFLYKMTDSDGKVITDATGAPRLLDYVQIFVTDFEIENGTADIIIANEIRQAKKDIIEIAEQSVKA